MFTVGEVNGNNVLTLRFSGKLLMEEYREGVAKCEALLRQHGRLRFYVDMTEFTGTDMQALWEGMMFDLAHGNQYGRSAIVGDKQWEEWAIKLSSLFFPRPLKFFYAQDAEKAWDWVNQPDA